VVVVVVSSFLLQPATAASAATALQPANWTKDRFESRLMVAPVVLGKTAPPAAKTGIIKDG
jgi:hypothetical protein